MPQPAREKKAGSRLKLLAVDTATTSCSVALAGPEGPLAELNYFGRQTHSKHLATMIHALLEMAASKIDAVDAFAVCSGPGTFTGLRIGMAAVKGMAAAGGKPVAAVSSLDVLAGQAGFSPGAVCPMIDARRQEVYTALYQSQDGCLVKVSEEQAVAPRKALAAIDRPCLFIGSGAVAYREKILEFTNNTACFADQSMNHPRAVTVARLGLEKLGTGDVCNAADLVLNYLRRSDAEKNR